MHDGITLEKLGIPTAVICTAPFVSSAKAMSALGGIPEFPFVVVPHPLGSLDKASLRKRAIMAAPEVMKILMQQ